MSDKYILDDTGNSKPEPDLMTWATFMEKGNRTVAVDHLGCARVSTVFLGLDHAFGKGPLVLWETMVFGGPLDGEQERYSSREAAIAGHAAMVKRTLAVKEN